MYFIGIIFLIQLTLLVIICKSAILVKKEDFIIVKRYGNFHRLLPPGLNVIVPFIDKTIKTKNETTVVEEITTTSGAVTIYDEKIEARVKEGCENIQVGCNVKIVANEGTILFVEKI